MNNDFVIIKNIKLFIYSLDVIVVNIPNRDKVIKEPSEFIEQIQKYTYDVQYKELEQDEVKWWNVSRCK